MDTLKSLTTSVQSLPDIPLESAIAHANHLQALTDDVDRQLTNRPDIGHLIGHNPIYVMTDNHRHHGQFMATVFRFRLYDLLARTIPWVYRAYSNHKFTYDYFPVELSAWKQSISNKLLPEEAAPILSVYDWMLANHDLVTRLASSSTPLATPAPDEWIETRGLYFQALLKGDAQTCLGIAREAVTEESRLPDFYMHVLQPVMYDVGNLWEAGKLSVASEHLATAITGRVISTLYANLSMPAPTKGLAVITSAPGERHEMGGWMISDLLELSGWRVKYLGADTPAKDIVHCVQEELPTVLMLSATMPFHIPHVADLIQKIRGRQELAPLHIMVGGGAFNQSEENWKQVGADAWALNAEEAVEMAEKRFMEQRL